MVRSLHIIGSRGSGGAERFFARLSTALADTGNPVLAITRPGARLRGKLGENVEHRMIPMRNVRDLVSVWQIRRAIADWRPDIVQTYMGRATRLTRLRDRSGPVHIARLGGYYPIRQYRRADAWVANTRGIVDYLIGAGFPAGRVFQIPNFVDTPTAGNAADRERLRLTLGIPPAAHVILGIGRLHASKGFADLLAAFARLPAVLGGRPVFFILVGAGPLERTLQRQAEALGLEARLRWPGWQAEPAPYYRFADLMVCPSRHEPYGNVILEAWSHRTAVLATATAGGRELIAPGENGWLVPCGDAERLATAMTTLLQNDVLRAQLAMGGEETLRTRFSRHAVVKAYLELYQKLLNERGEE